MVAAFGLWITGAAVSGRMTDFVEEFAAHVRIPCPARRLDRHIPVLGGIQPERDDTAAGAAQ